MGFEINVVNESQLGPFSIGATYENHMAALTASGISFKFEVNGDKKYITIEEPVLNGIQFKEIGTYSERQTRLIRIDSFEHHTLDELSGLSEFFQSVFGKPDEFERFGDKRNFVHDLFQNSEHQVVRDAYKSVQGKPSMMRWNFNSTKCILLFSILEHEQDPFVAFSSTIRMSPR